MDKRKNGEGTIINRWEKYGNKNGKKYQCRILCSELDDNSALLYPNLLKSIREKLGDNLVIIPSSTREATEIKKAPAIKKTTVPKKQPKRSLQPKLQKKRIDLFKRR